MKVTRLVASLWILVAAVAAAALPRDQPVLVNCLAVTPLRPLAVVVGDPPSFTSLEPAGVLGADGVALVSYAALPDSGGAIRVDSYVVFGAIAGSVVVPEGAAVVGALAPASPSTVSVQYAVAGGDVRVEAARAVGALVSGGMALTIGRGPVFGRVGLADPTGVGVPVFQPLRESLGVVEVRLAFAQLLGVTALAVDLFVVPIDLWVSGPLGELRKQANAAAARGNKAAFQKLAGRYWALFNAAVERRRVLGAGAGER